MEEIGIRELTVEQLERICEIGEKAARDYILSKVAHREVSRLDITVDAEGSGPVNIAVEVEVSLSPSLRNFDVDSLTKEAIVRALDAIDKHLREQTCRSAR